MWGGAISEETKNHDNMIYYWQGNVYIFNPTVEELKI